MESAFDSSKPILPLLRFGIVADVQYADNDDKKAWYNPNKTRFYRNSLKQVEKAFNFWNKVDSVCPVRFILQLGDIIDALNKSSDSQLAIERALNCFLHNPSMPTFHTIGKLKHVINNEIININISINLKEIMNFAILTVKKWVICSINIFSNDRILMFHFN